ncbi:hypothetical protein [Amycolatopsis vancoresmycina]|uniref:Uncharacterized protein n=1 Tax=Amycolatopsis vancoresmycina DSM 44592 TaxID=1292037 RepID=R1IDJ6_9PSEU|nr:hypothetical protein [Amycolatopsis vancoresmycina]EOD70576.1 hypothetical protein H480_00235 [Amycolatopsis vancoresmycina DSM 44592]
MTVYDIAGALPAVPALRALCRALAALDVVLDPGSEDRYHHYHPAWAPGAELASMRDGSGNEYSILFTAAGACLRGFDHESPMSPYATDDEEPWPGVLDELPGVFRDGVTDPAFCDEFGTPYVTVCLWREHTDTVWRHGTIEFPPGGDDGAGWLFALLTDRRPEAFQDWAQDYYETPVNLDAVRHFYAGQPVTPAVVSALNPATTLAAVAGLVAATGYPIVPAR